MPDVDLFVRSSGEQRTSNFLLWQSAYAEMVFLDTLWPDFDRRDLWRAIEIYAARDRRYGGAVDAVGADPAAGAVGDPAGLSPAGLTRRQRRAAQSAQVPTISRVWRTSTNPCSALTVSAQRSTAGPSTSTVRPHERQTRWWWCPVLHRR